MRRDTIFISYSRQDAEVRDALLKHLHVILGVPPRVRIFADTAIRTGEEWHRRIISEADRALVMVLLISADYLTSEFVRTVELPRAALAARQGLATIACLYVRPCPADSFRLRVEDDDGGSFRVAVVDYQGINDPGEPLMTLQTGPAQEAVMARAAVEIVELAAQALRSPPPLRRTERDVEKGHAETASSLPEQDAPTRVPIDDRDAEGFYTPRGISLIVENSGLLDPRESEVDQLLLFRTAKQRTWLVATQRLLVCILDDENTRAKGRLIQWTLAHHEAEPVVAGTGGRGLPVVEIGRIGPWYYSAKLHPDPGRLEAAIRDMLQGSAAG